MCAEPVLRYTSATAAGAALADGLHRRRVVGEARAGTDAAVVDAGGRAVTFLERLVPAPLLSAALLALWLVLARSTSLGQVSSGSRSRSSCRS